MHSILRFSWRAVALIIWLFIGLAILWFAFGFMSFTRQQRTIAWWSKGLIKGCQIQVQYLGRVPTQPVLFVLNHVSWLDIFVLNQQRATAFVAKKEIKRWPIVGSLVSKAGTIYIDRDQRHAIQQVVQQLEQKLQRNQAVGVFPEGKTSDGLHVQRFYSSLFAVALRTQIAIQPVALRFYDGAQRSGRIAFVGNQSLVRNAWYVLSKPHVRIECEFLSLWDYIDYKHHNRAVLAQQVHQQISRAVLKGM